jgi:hypothetical protein
MWRMNNRRLSSSRADSRAAVAPRQRATVAALFLGAIFFAGAACLHPVPAHALDLAHLMGFGNDDPTLETFKLIHVANLKAMMDSEARSLHIYDANVAETRAKYGVIPGATLLDSDDRYDLSVLPRDKKAKLVFYCANSL